MVERGDPDWHGPWVCCGFLFVRVGILAFTERSGRSAESESMCRLPVPRLRFRAMRKLGKLALRRADLPSPIQSPKAAMTFRRIGENPTRTGHLDRHPLTTSSKISDLAETMSVPAHRPVH